MKLFVRPVVNKNGKVFNLENVLCPQIVCTAVFSSKRGVTVAPIWLGVYFLSGLAFNEVWIRTDLICRASQAFKEAHRGGNLLRDQIIRVPSAMFKTMALPILETLVNTWPFKLDWKQLKKNHKALRKLAAKNTLQPA